ncbi:MAG: SpoIID/LytB domain-containing protein [Candidatus Oleimicrobiaceae bacterium]
MENPQGSFGESTIRQTTKHAIPKPTPESVIEADVAAQNSHDWSAFLSIRTAKAGPPENRVDYQVLKEKYPENDFMQNIVTARLVGIKALPLSLLEGLTRTDKYLELYAEVKAYYVGIEYQLKKENRAFYNGVNYRLYVLAPEEKHLAMVEASEAPVFRMVESGYGFDTPDANIALMIQEVRFRTGKFVNPKGEAIAKVAAGDHDQPNHIRIYRVALGQIDEEDFYYYVKNVLPKEWMASWPSQALRAGAVASKMYGWYRVYVPKYPGQGFDV